jgi:hypothetical protein
MSISTVGTVIPFRLSHRPTLSGLTRHLLEKRVLTALELLPGQIFPAARDGPIVPEGVRQYAAAVAFDSQKLTQRIGGKRVLKG